MFRAGLARVGCNSWGRVMMMRSNSMSSSASYNKIFNGLPQSAALLNKVQTLPAYQISTMKMSNLHTKGDQELHGFLTEEIASEKKQLRSASLPKSLGEFEIKTEGSEVVLSKKTPNETVEINLTVNHTVDAEEYDDVQQQNPNQESAAEMRSKPNFEIDIKRGNTTLSFSCSYVRDPPPSEEEYSDAFVIDEITMYEGEWNDKVYAVAGDILDGYLYDLLMNILEERGISNEFVEQLSDFCTNYEHQQYIGLLTRLQNFVGQK